MYFSVNTAWMKSIHDISPKLIIIIAQEMLINAQIIKRMDYTIYKKSCSKASLFTHVQ